MVYKKGVNGYSYFKLCAKQPFREELKSMGLYLKRPIYQCFKGFHHCFGAIKGPVRRFQ